MAEKRRNREFWKALVAKQGSGETATAFARRNGVCVRTYQWWRWRLQAETGAAARVPAPALLPVRVVASTAPKARWSGCEPESVIEIDVAGGTRLRVRAGTDAEYVAALVKRLASC